MEEDAKKSFVDVASWMKDSNSELSYLFDDNEVVEYCDEECEGVIMGTCLGATDVMPLTACVEKEGMRRMDEVGAKACTTLTLRLALVLRWRRKRGAFLIEDVDVNDSMTIVIAISRIVISDVEGEVVR